MADENQNPSDKFTNDVVKATGTVVNAAKAAGQAAAGDIAGAVVTAVKDENIRKTIIAVILLAALLIACCSMLIGTAIMVFIDNICKAYQQEWEETYTEYGIRSNGSLIYQYLWGGTVATFEGVGAALEEIFGSQEQAHSSNAAIEEEGSGAKRTELEDDAFETTMKSIKDYESLAGRNGALQQRIDMIKGRVAQRGEQLYFWANGQYALEAIGISLAEVLISSFSNPILFNGVDLENSRVHIDDTVFMLTDLQALKILAAYSVQHDCQLAQIDMWDLMDYCGWYALELAPLDTDQFEEDSIYYHGDSSIAFESEIGGVVQKGEILSSTYYHLDDPIVPVWTGTFAPQWYYEQLHQMEENNRLYDQLAASGNTEALEGMIRYETDKDGNIILDNFRAISQFQPYGLIDKIYTSSTATLIVSRTAYHGADEYFDEAVSKFTGIILQQWLEAYGDMTKETEGGNIVTCNSKNENSYTITDPDDDAWYRLVDGSTGKLFDSDRYHKEDGDTLVFEGLENAERYILYESRTFSAPEGEEIVIVPARPPGIEQLIKNDPILGALLTKDDVTEENGWELDSRWTGTKAIVVGEDEDGNQIVEEKPYNYELWVKKLDSFTTFDRNTNFEAYEIVLNLEVTYSARSIDELCTELIGLWPGSLENTEVGKWDNVYPRGYANYDNLEKYWSDRYTDKDGKEHKIQFVRQQGYQVEAYQDMILSIAAILEYDTTGLFEPDYGYGDTIVSVAEKEMAYYHANNLSGGMRYWNMAKDVIGWNFGADLGWCACFVLCCAYQAGCIGPGGAFGDFGTKWSFSPAGLYDDLVSIGKAEPHIQGDGYVPVPGDIIFFDDTVSMDEWGIEHVAIVQKVENGKITSIDGNCSAIGVNDNTYPSYEIGTYCYTNDEGLPVYICAYVHPNYPPAYILDPEYLTVPSSASPKLGIQYVEDTLLAGITRLRKSQILPFLEKLQVRFPTLYSKELYEAAAAENWPVFQQEWSRAGQYGNESQFKVAQQTLYNALFVSPVLRKAAAENGFNWTGTEIREEFMISVVTTSDQTDALAAFLVSLSTGQDEAITDADFLALLNQGDFLRTQLEAHKDTLWPEDTEKLRDIWISSILQVVIRLGERDLSATNE